MHKHYIFSDVVIILTLLYWIGYSVAVIIYLNILTRRYLMTSDRDPIIAGKNLKSYQELLAQYKDRTHINILVLTGGGVRGLVPLHVLSELERQTGKKSGELFDFVSGTSTGAISVSSLTVGDGDGGYKFSAQYVEEHYLTQSRSMFTSPWYHQYLTCFGLLAPRFLPDNKLKILDEYFGDSTIGELKGNLLIPVYNIDQNNLQIIKNWNPPHGKSNENYLVKDLINGASNPPMIFPPVAFTVKNQDHLLIDPAVILNNPILHVLSYVRGLLPDKHINLVFIGNGGSGVDKYDYRSMFGFGLYGFYQYLFSAPSLSSRLYTDFMEDYLLDAEQVDKKISYYPIMAMPKEKMSPTSMHQRNFDKISKFAKEMVEQNEGKLMELAAVLTKGR